MLIFDLDGTLLNTAYDLHASLNYALKTHNLKQITLDETLSLLGNGIDILVAGAIENGKNNPDFEKIYTTFKTYYNNHINDYTVPYDGIIELLKTIKQKNIKMGIVSNKFDEGVKALQKKFFNNLIDNAQGVTESIPKKPSPDAVLKLIQTSNALNETNIYIGDSEVDIETAKNAGIDCISVSWGFRSKEYLQSINAKIIIDKPSELLDYIK
jgi:phosphoglycolate phosphatase